MLPRVDVGVQKMADLQHQSAPTSSGNSVTFADEFAKLKDTVDAHERQLLCSVSNLQGLSEDVGVLGKTMDDRFTKQVESRFEKLEADFDNLADFSAQGHADFVYEPQSSFALEDKIASLDADMAELSDMTAQQHVELKNCLESRTEQLQLSVSSSIQDLSNASSTTERLVADLQARLAKVDRMIGDELEGRMRGALKAAIVPLAESVSAKLAEFEQRIDRQGG